MEEKFGHDFSEVRVHTGAEAERTSRDLGGIGYTVGRDVVFGPGQYSPETLSGKRLIAHELTHVIQQGQLRRDLSLHSTQPFTGDQDTRSPSLRPLAAPDQSILQRQVTAEEVAEYGASYQCMIAAIFSGETPESCPERTTSRPRQGRGRRRTTEIASTPQDEFEQIAERVTRRFPNIADRIRRYFVSFTAAHVQVPFRPEMWPRLPAVLSDPASRYEDTLQGVLRVLRLLGSDPNGTNLHEFFLHTIEANESALNLLELTLDDRESDTRLDESVRIAVSEARDQMADFAVQALTFEPLVLEERARDPEQREFREQVLRISQGELANPSFPLARLLSGVFSNLSLEQQDGVHGLLYFTSRQRAQRVRFGELLPGDNDERGFSGYYIGQFLGQSFWLRENLEVYALSSRDELVEAFQRGVLSAQWMVPLLQGVEIFAMGTIGGVVLGPSLIGQAVLAGGISFLNSAGTEAEEVRYGRQESINWTSIGFATVFSAVTAGVGGLLAPRLISFITSRPGFQSVTVNLLAEFLVGLTQDLLNTLLEPAARRAYFWAIDAPDVTEDDYLTEVSRQLSADQLLFSLLGAVLGLDQPDIDVPSHPRRSESSVSAPPTPLSAAAHVAERTAMSGEQLDAAARTQDLDFSQLDIDFEREILPRSTELEGLNQPVPDGQQSLEGAAQEADRAPQIEESAEPRPRPYESSEAASFHPHVEVGIGPGHLTVEEGTCQFCVNPCREFTDFLERVMNEAEVDDAAIEPLHELIEDVRAHEEVFQSSGGENQPTLLAQLRHFRNRLFDLAPRGSRLNHYLRNRDWLIHILTGSSPSDVLRRALQQLGLHGSQLEEAISRVSDDPIAVLRDLHPIEVSPDQLAARADITDELSNLENRIPSEIDNPSEPDLTEPGLLPELDQEYDPTYEPNREGVSLTVDMNNPRVRALFDQVMERPDLQGNADWERYYGLVRSRYQQQGVLEIGRSLRSTEPHAVADTDSMRARFIQEMGNQSITSEAIEAVQQHLSRAIRQHGSGAAAVAADDAVWIARTTGRLSHSQSDVTLWPSDPIWGVWRVDHIVELRHGGADNVHNYFPVPQLMHSIKTSAMALFSGILSTLRAE
jgi:hypothetical protein